jgi:hypothetical protein
VLRLLWVCAALLGCADGPSAGEAPASDAGGVVDLALRRDGGALDAGKVPDAETNPYLIGCSSAMPDLAGALSHHLPHKHSLTLRPSPHSEATRPGQRGARRVRDAQRIEAEDSPIVQAESPSGQTKGAPPGSGREAGLTRPPNHCYRVTAGSVVAERNPRHANSEPAKSVMADGHPTCFTTVILE